MPSDRQLYAPPLAMQMMLQAPTLNAGSRLCTYLVTSNIALHYALFVMLQRPNK